MSVPGNGRGCFRIVQGPVTPTWVWVEMALYIVDRISTGGCCQRGHVKSWPGTYNLGWPSEYSDPPRMALFTLHSIRRPLSGVMVAATGPGMETAKMTS